MTELEKLEAGLEYSFWDSEVNARKLNATRLCEQLRQIDQTDEAEIARLLTQMFGSAGEGPWCGPNFQCDCGKNIFVGDNFLANGNVTILDIAPVHIGDNCMIAPGTVISTVGHPLSAKGRAGHLAFARPITIGDNVWIGANCTILPGVTIGDNVVIAAGAVVNKDIPDNALAGGVPARIIRYLENDL